MKTIVLIAICFLMYSCSNTHSISNNTYEGISDYRFGNFSSFTDSPDKKYFYHLYFRNDSIFNYTSYYQIIEHGNTVNLDSFQISGTYLIKGRELFFYNNQGFLKKKPGIKWKLKKDRILIKGYNTKMVSLNLEK